MRTHVFWPLLEKIQENVDTNVTPENLLIYIHFVSHIKIYREMRDMFGVPTSNIFRTIEKLSNIGFQPVFYYIAGLFYDFQLFIYDFPHTLYYK